MTIPAPGARCRVIERRGEGSSGGLLYCRVNGDSAGSERSSPLVVVSFFSRIFVQIIPHACSVE